MYSCYFLYNTVAPFVSLARSFLVVILDRVCAMYSMSSKFFVERVGFPQQFGVSLEQGIPTHIKPCSGEFSVFLLQQIALKTTRPYFYIIVYLFSSPTLG